ncbi:macro domain-containing protein [Haloferula chungangensis]|uniref:Macro domain-containing protein n=1 Tax=Haloferula chungangensis TaxID=1048331 RepID=A0ABW2LBF6_9BACT
MNYRLLHANIVETSADALIYSTNVQLMLGGGVGACLLEKFGSDFQRQLQGQLDKSGRQLAKVGEIFHTDITDGPWKLIIHTVAADPFYHTDPEVVRSLLARSFATCREKDEIRSIIMSPLGAGYGDLELDVFLRIASEEALKLEGSQIESLTICCDWDSAVDDLAKTAETMDPPWSIETSRR